VTPSRVFRIAGWYGLLVVLPNYVLEARIGADLPPAITHPEFYYGFTGVAAAWQVLFLLIAAQPSRLRPAMLPSALEKASFSVAVFVLFALDRCPPQMLPFAAIDATLGLLFVWAWRSTPEPG
jgi:hypothetical protein